MGRTFKRAAGVTAPAAPLGRLSEVPQHGGFTAFLLVEGKPQHGFHADAGTLLAQVQGLRVQGHLRGIAAGRQQGGGGQVVPLAVEDHAFVMEFLELCTHLGNGFSEELGDPFLVDDGRFLEEAAVQAEQELH